MTNLELIAAYSRSRRRAKLRRLAACAVIVFTFVAPAAFPAEAMVVVPMIDGAVGLPGLPTTGSEEPTVATEVAQKTSSPAVALDVCHEDEPCWDCSTMGNRICGPQVTDPPPGAELPKTPDNPDGWDTFEQCVEFEGDGDGGLATCADIFGLPCGDPRVDPHREDC